MALISNAFLAEAIKPRATRDRSKVVPALVLVLSVLAIVTIVALEHRAATNRDAEAQLVRVDAALTRLQGDPFAGMNVIGGIRSAAYAAVRADKRQFDQALAGLNGPAVPPALRALIRPLHANFAAIDQLLPIATGKAFATRSDARLFPALKTSTEMGWRSGWRRRTPRWRPRPSRRLVPTRSTGRCCAGTS